MLNIASLSPKNQTELKSIGIYQMVGGGLGLVLLIPNGLSVFLSTYIIGGLLFSFSIFSGYSCFKFKNGCFTLTFINQTLQALAMVIGSFTFEYVSGAGLAFNIDITNSLTIGFDFNLSTLSAGLFDDGTEKYHFGFNLIAMFIIYLTEKIKKNLRPKT